jgi:hypothetical protein
VVTAARGGRHLLWLLLPGILLLGGGGTARALSLGPWGGEPASLDSTLGLHFHLHGDNQNAREDDDEYGDLHLLYDLQGRWGRHGLYVRLDTVRFFAPPAGETILLHGSADYADELTFEKLAYTYSSPELSATVGDAYVTFGRGLLLSLRRNDELGLDTSLRGARVDVTTPYVRALFVSGWTNATNLDPFSERLRFASCTPTYSGEGFDCDPFRIDPADALVAGRVELRWPGVGTLGLQQAVLRRWGETDGTFARGFSLELLRLPWRLGDLYGEAVWLDPETAGESAGHGLYGAASVVLGPVEVLLEGKQYDRFEFGTLLPDDRRHFVAGRKFLYHEPPSLEPLTSISFDNVDVAGGRARLGLPLSRLRSALQLSVARFEDGLAASATEIWHLYGGVEQGLPRGVELLLTGGWRRQQGLTTGTADNLSRLLHVEGKLVVPVRGPHALSLGASLLAWHDEFPDYLEDGSRVLDSHDYDQGELTLTYSWAPRLAVALLLGFDDKLTEARNPRLAALEREEPPAEQDPRAAYEQVRTVFPAGTVSWQPTDWIVLQALAGSLRGGKKCVASICREYPSFTGAQLDATLRF